MKVIFITGLGRSGTNLIDLVLSSHSQVQGLGEIQRLAKSYRNDGHCACGAPSLRECGFWSQVNESLTKKLGQGVPSLDLESNSTDTFNKQNRVFFDTIAEISGTKYITDNSKSPKRLRRLLAAPGIEVIPLQVTRDPRGCAYSQFKRKRKYIGPAFTYAGRYMNLYSILRNKKHISVEYEELAQDTEGTLRQIMHQLDLDFEPELLDWAAKTHHNIGSARAVLRKTEGSLIREDKAWESGFPEYKKSIIKLITWPARTLNHIKRKNLHPDSN